MSGLPPGGGFLRSGQNRELTKGELLGSPRCLNRMPYAVGVRVKGPEEVPETGSEAPLSSPRSLWVTGVREEGRETTSPGARWSTQLSLLPAPPRSGFGRLPELFPRAVSSLACRQVWMFCQHSREFMIACRCASKNTLYPKQKLMQA